MSGFDDEDYECAIGGTAGGSIEARCRGNAFAPSHEAILWFQSKPGDLDGVSVASLDWDFNLNVTSSSNAILREISICRLNSSGVSVQQIAKLSYNENIPTGVLTKTLLGGAVTFGTNESFLVVVSASSSSGFSNGVVVATLDQSIDVPYDVVVPPVLGNAGSMSLSAATGVAVPVGSAGSINLEGKSAVAKAVGFAGAMLVSAAMAVTPVVGFAGSMDLQGVSGSTTTTQSGSGGASLNKRKLITVDTSTFGQGSAKTNFPMWLEITDTDIRDGTRSDRFDISITASDGVTVWPHEVEYFNPTTGKMGLHVSVPSLPTESNLSFYVNYGDASQATSLENPTDLWKDYHFVAHFCDHPGGAVVRDKLHSSATDWPDMVENGTLTFGTEGDMGGYVTFDGDPLNYLTAGNPNFTADDSFSVQCLVKFADLANNANGRIFSKASDTGSADNVVTLATQSDDPYAFRAYVSADSPASPHRFDSPTSQMTFDVNELLFATLTYDGVDEKLSLNGNLSSDDFGKIGNVQQTADNVYIGKHEFSTGTSIDGDLFSLRICKEVRDVDWAATEWNMIENPAGFVLTVGAEETVGTQPVLGFAGEITLSASNGVAVLVGEAPSVDLTGAQGTAVSVGEAGTVTLEAAVGTPVSVGQAGAMALEGVSGTAVSVTLGAAGSMTLEGATGVAIPVGVTGSVTLEGAGGTAVSVGEAPELSLLGVAGTVPQPPSALLTANQLAVPAEYSFSTVEGSGTVFGNVEAKATVRWAHVPNQRYATPGTLTIGVMAYHVSGVKNVAFGIHQPNRSSLLEVSETTVDPSSNLPLYNVTIDLTESGGFTAGQLYYVDAVVTPNHGVPRADRIPIFVDLVDDWPALTLYLDDGASGGNGERGSPFGSLKQCIDHIKANGPGGGKADGSTIYLLSDYAEDGNDHRLGATRVGSSSATTGWTNNVFDGVGMLTIAQDPALGLPARTLSYTQDGGNDRWLEKLHFKDLEVSPSLKSGWSGTSFGGPDTDDGVGTLIFPEVWVDNVDMTRGETFPGTASSSDLISGGARWWRVSATDSFLHNTGYGLRQDAYVILRNLFQEVGNDMIIQPRSDMIYAGNISRQMADSSSGTHSDQIQSTGRDMRNMIISHNAMLDPVSFGNMAFLLSTNGVADVDGLSVVGNLFHTNAFAAEGKIEAEHWNNFVFWHNTIVNNGVNLGINQGSGTPGVLPRRNNSVRHNVHCVTPGIDTSWGVQSADEEVRDNNHFAESQGNPGTNSTVEGDVALLYEDWQNNNWTVKVGSPIDGGERASQGITADRIVKYAIVIPSNAADGLSYSEHSATNPSLGATGGGSAASGPTQGSAGTMTLAAASGTAVSVGPAPSMDLVGVSATPFLVTQGFAGSMTLESASAVAVTVGHAGSIAISAASGASVTSTVVWGGQDPWAATPQPASVGDPGNHFYSKTCIGRWDNVNDERVEGGGMHRVGVVAAHATGIDHVRFALMGPDDPSSWTQVSEMVVSSTHAHTYETHLDLSTVPTAGKYVVRAIVYPNHGPPRVVSDLRIYIDPSGLSLSAIAWCTPGGAGTQDGLSEPNAAPTMHAAAEAIGDPNRGVVYMTAGLNHSIGSGSFVDNPDSWLVFKPAPGVPRDQVEVQDYEPTNIRRVKFEGIKFNCRSTATGSCAGVLRGASASHDLWCHDVIAEGDGPGVPPGQPSTLYPDPAGQFPDTGGFSRWFDSNFYDEIWITGTDNPFHDERDVLNGGSRTRRYTEIKNMVRAAFFPTFIRNVYSDQIGEDRYRNLLYAVNFWDDGPVEIGETGSHDDLAQWDVRADTDNIVLLNFKGSRLGSNSGGAGSGTQGIFLDNVAASTNTQIQSMALINGMVDQWSEPLDDSQKASKIKLGVCHMIMRHVVMAQAFDWVPHRQDERSGFALPYRDANHHCIQNSIFEGFAWHGGSGGDSNGTPAGTLAAGTGPRPELDPLGINNHIHLLDERHEGGASPGWGEYLGPNHNTNGGTGITATYNNFKATNSAPFSPPHHLLGSDHVPLSIWDPILRDFTNGDLRATVGGPADGLARMATEGAVPKVWPFDIYGDPYNDVSPSLGAVEINPPAAVTPVLGSTGSMTLSAGSGTAVPVGAAGSMQLLAESGTAISVGQAGSISVTAGGGAVPSIGATPTMQLLAPSGVAVSVGSPASMDLVGVIGMATDATVGFAGSIALSAGGGVAGSVGSAGSMDILGPSGVAVSVGRAPSIGVLGVGGQSFIVAVGRAPSLSLEAAAGTAVSVGHAGTITLEGATATDPTVYGFAGTMTLEGVSGLSIGFPTTQQGAVQTLLDKASSFAVAIKGEDVVIHPGGDESKAVTIRARVDRHEVGPHPLSEGRTLRHNATVWIPIKAVEGRLEITAGKDRILMRFVKGGKYELGRVVNVEDDRGAFWRVEAMR